MSKSFQSTWKPSRGHLDVLWFKKLGLKNEVLSIKTDAIELETHKTKIYFGSLLIHP